MAALLLPSLASAATVLWYKGDADGSNAYFNTVSGGFDGATYDNFMVPAGGWNVSAVFSDNGVPTGTDIAAFTTANWSIRTGMGVGNGGTVLYSGTASPAVWTLTGRAPISAFTEYQVTVSGLSSIVLTPGIYWLNVQPIASSAYNTLTVGANAISTPFVSDPLAVYYSVSSGLNYNGLSHGFSMGVTGTVAPEPATFGLLGLGALLLAARRRRA